MVKLRKQEQGRSMVEMLGVLAIIGVLSVAGIAGYSMAMRNHRANEIANAASMLYIMGIAQNQGNGDGNLGYTSATGLNLPNGVSMEYQGNGDKSVHITLSTPEDCTIVADKLGGTCSGSSLTFNPEGATGGTPQQEDPCSKCHSAYQSENNVCSGTTCTGCLVPADILDGYTGDPCVSPSNCNHPCDKYCFDNGYEESEYYQMCLSRL